MAAVGLVEGGESCFGVLLGGVVAARFLCTFPRKFLGRGCFGAFPWGVFLEIPGGVVSARSLCTFPRKIFVGHCFGLVPFGVFPLDVSGRGIPAEPFVGVLSGRSSP